MRTIRKRALPAALPMKAADGKQLSVSQYIRQLDKLGLSIIWLMMNRAIGGKSVTRELVNRDIEGSDLLWEAAEAADNLVAAMAREDPLAPLVAKLRGRQKASLVIKRQQRLAATDKAVHRWNRVVRAGFSEEDRLRYPSYASAVFDAARRSGLDLKGAGPHAPPNDRAALRVYASDCRHLSEHIRKRVMSTWLLAGSRRPRDVALAAVALTARQQNCPMPDVAHRMVCEFYMGAGGEPGVGADGVPRPSEARPAALAKWEAKQKSEWLKALRDAERSADQLTEK